MDGLDALPAFADDQSHMKDRACGASFEKNEVAGPDVLYFYLSAFVGLIAGTGGKRDVEIFHHITGEARTVETAGALAAGPVFGTE